MGVKVRVNSNIAEILGEYRSDVAAVRTATYRALNRAIDKTATETSREIRKVYFLKDAAIKRTLTKIRAGPRTLTARLELSGKRVALIEFDARQNKLGVSVRIKRLEGRKTVKGAFIATRRWKSWQDGAEHSDRGVFRRVGRERLPIKYLRSLSIPQAFSNDKVVEAIRRIAIVTFEKNFEQQMNFLTRSRSGGDGG